MAYIIIDTCTKDQECVAVCPVDCIQPTDKDAKFGEHRSTPRSPRWQESQGN